MKILKKDLLTLVACCVAPFAAFGHAVKDSKSLIPYGNGTWFYDGYTDSAGNKVPPKAGLFLQYLQAYNKTAAPAHQFNQLFPYGGDLEMYCDGAGDSDPGSVCLPNSFLTVYYPPTIVSKSTNDWESWYKMGDSGFRSVQSYLHIPGVNQILVDLDGRVDNAKNGDYNYLDQLNILSQQDAQHFADVVAKNVCVDDSIDGVQFDVEPFSFTGEGGSVSGPGQQYFYTQIAKDFAGYNANADDPAGINSDASTDPFHCVDAAHPNGRIFSVFTFAKNVTPSVVSVFNHHGNGYVIDSLYDLGNKPGGNLNTIAEFQQLITAEIAAMQQKGVPYQFAIPGAASVHEYEKGPNGTGVGAGHQLDYVQTALQAIQSVRTDPNFKGIDIWGWNAPVSNDPANENPMWWHNMQFYPAVPEDNVLSYLSNNL